MENKIIDVDETHRIRIQKEWNAYKGDWTYEVILEEYKRFLFKKRWGVTGWENSKDLFVRTRIYSSEYAAIKFAEETKKNYLNNI